jgi:putative two-component system response regulator
MAKILVVDDDRDILAIISSILTREGHTCTCIGTAEEALEVIRVGDHGFDCLVSDVGLPRMSGFDLFGSLDKQMPGVPRILMTGMPDLAHLRRIIKMGIFDYIEKPFMPDQFLEVVGKALRKRSLWKEDDDYRRVLEKMVYERTFSSEYEQLRLVLFLAHAGELRDELTGAHVLRVGHYCRILADGLGFDRAFVQRIMTAAPLHDLGKIGVPDKVLLKPGKLTEEEWRIMRGHTRIGRDILALGPSRGDPLVFWQAMREIQAFDDVIESGVIEMAKNIALSHHERWDGTGYPDGLKGEEIPDEARIASVADVYDALRSVRPYKEAMSVERTEELIEAGAGTQFDPAVVEVFARKAKDLERVFAKYRDESGE